MVGVAEWGRGSMEQPMRVVREVGVAVGRGYSWGVHSLVGSVKGCDQWEVLVCRVGVAKARGRGYGVDERSLVDAIEGRRGSVKGRGQRKIQ